MTLEKPFIGVEAEADVTFEEEKTQDIEFTWGNLIANTLGFDSVKRYKTTIFIKKSSDNSAGTNGVANTTEADSSSSNALLAVFHTIVITVFILIP